MCIVTKTKNQLYNSIPLFISEDICKEKMLSILHNKIYLKHHDQLFTDLWDCKYINKLLLDNYKWKTCYEFWQIYKFHNEPTITLYDFIKLELHDKYFTYWENIIVKSINKYKDHSKP